MKIAGNYCRRIKSWVETLLTTHKAEVSAHHTDHQTASAESAEFSKVNVVVGEGYSQNSVVILKSKAVANLFVGAYAGFSNTTGHRNNFVGYQTGYSNTTSYYNNFMGSYAGYYNTTGCRNNFMGAYAGFSNTTASRNNFMGCQAGFSNTTGYYNNFMGQTAGYSNTTGHRNNFVGAYTAYYNTVGYRNNFVGEAAGYYNRTGNYNNFMGCNAGYYETESYKLIIDVFSRANEADGRIKALIYGVFNAATANQLLRINGKLELSVVSEYADNAAAIAGGLAVNTVYRTGDVMKIVH